MNNEQYVIAVDVTGNGKIAFLINESLSKDEKWVMNLNRACIFFNKCTAKIKRKNIKHGKLMLLSEARRIRCLN